MQFVATDKAQDDLFDFCKKYGFNRILLQIHLDPQLKFIQPEQWKRFLKQARLRGIAVEALDGAPDMARKANWDNTLKILEAVLEFNEAQPQDERFVGIHYDIEPYVSPTWKKGDQVTRHEMMMEYLEFLAKARQRLAAVTPHMVMAADIPMWYDRKPAEFSIDFGGQTKNFHQHIQDLTDYIGIMSYRRKADGNNGVIAAVSDEMAYAEKIGKVVCPALETIKLKDEPTITFYGLPAERFWETKKAVESELSARPGFGGMLIHSYRGMRELLELPAE